MKEYTVEDYQEAISNIACHSYLTTRDLQYDILKLQHLVDLRTKQSSEIERLRILNEGKAKEYFKLLEMYNKLDAKLNEIAEEVDKYAKGGRFEFFQLPIDFADIIKSILESDSE